MKNNIEEFFDYKWQNDKNLAIMNDDDQTILQQMPEEIQLEIYTNFLFKTFLSRFRYYFKIENTFSHRKHAFFNWKDKEYYNFMTDVF